MKQLAQYQDGRLELQEVPAPMPPPGGILVRTTCSVISPGTEKMKVEQARMSLLAKAKARPDQVRKVLDTARTLGWKAAIEKVRNRLETPTPLGYSLAGMVVAVDEANARFRVGDRVACGGAECANHAEMVAIPDLLATKIPDGVADWQAAYTTLCSISLEAVRQSGAALGERVLVMGQGLVGLLATSLLRAAGVRVMASDLVSSRLTTAQAMGAERVVNSAQASLEDEVRHWTDGQGLDAVLICVGGGGKAIADTAISALRDRGVMVIVGMHDAELTWKTAYLKDIQVRYSRSYGPGRYDPQYEWAGRDYPIGHVRWTENRNFEACLQLMSTGALDLHPVTTRRAEFADAVQVYQDLLQPGNTDIGVVLEYRGTGVSPVSGAGGILPASDVKEGRMPSLPATGETPVLHILGAGNFARTMLLPHLKNQLPFGIVVNATGLSARQAKEKFGFASATTHSAEVFSSAHSGEAVLIGTRHHLHAPMVLQALEQHQHVFVEKPLCLNPRELEEIDQALAKSQGSVMVGFNRRFAPATQAARSMLKDLPGPKTLAYHVFAGPLAPDHWYANLEESGGRILGEGCHFLDFACHLLGESPLRVAAQAQGADSFTAQVEFSGGSSFQLIYSAEGDYGFPKETFRVFASGTLIECENFMKLTRFHNRKSTVKKFHSKGHAEEMAAWLGYLKGTAEHPLPYPEAQTSMRLTFSVLQAIRERRLVEVLEPQPNP